MSRYLLNQSIASNGGPVKPTTLETSNSREPDASTVIKKSAPGAVNETKTASGPLAPVKESSTSSPEVASPAEPPKETTTATPFPVWAEDPHLADYQVWHDKGLVAWKPDPVDTDPNHELVKCLGPTKNVWTSQKATSSAGEPETSTKPPAAASTSAPSQGPTAIQHQLHSKPPPSLINSTPTWKQTWNKNKPESVSVPTSCTKASSSLSILEEVASMAESGDWDGILASVMDVKQALAQPKPAEIPKPKKVSPRITGPSSPEAPPAHKPAFSKTAETKVESPTAAATVETPPTEERRLLLLYSQQSLNREVVANQQKALSVLEAHQVPFDKLDGADAANRERRNELFGISSLRAQYPQFFVLEDNQTTFWGDWEKFELSNELGTLSVDLGFGSKEAAPPVPTPTSNEPKEWNGRILVLYSQQSLKREVVANQQKALAVLEANQVPFDTIDGADASNRERRNELFRISGIRAQYPQFFFVDNKKTTTLWGDWEKFELSNEMGTLESDMRSLGAKSGSSPSQSEQATMDSVDYLNKNWGYTASNCGKCGISNSKIEGRLMQCGLCKKAYYCSVQCFNEDLPKHQEFCRTTQITPRQQPPPAVQK